MKQKNIAVIGLLILAGFAMAMPAEARLAPPGNQYDRQAMINEANFAVTATTYGCVGCSFYGRWNYLNYDVPAVKAVAGRFGNNATYVGWTATGVANGKYWYGFIDGAGRGGQCLYFVNLLLYRSEADRRQYIPDGVRHYYWPDVNKQAADITTVKAGDVIFIPSTHAAVVVWRSGNSIEIVESNYQQPEKIAYRYTTIPSLSGAGYKVYIGVDYYNY
ncbi:hypothetical protein KKB43_06860 [Patescibacteria group bacterium]|nr:hypothetical protein [Patescibacteria group bacterium]